MKTTAHNRLAMMQRIVWSLALIFCSHFAQAESTYEANVRSSYSQQETYLVVSALSTGLKANSDLEPGIYSFLGGAKPVQILKGQALGVSRGFTGVLEHFQITSQTEKNEAIAVIDGALTVFSQKSRPNKVDSIVVFGSKTHPILDPLNKRPVALAPITSLDDVKIFQISSVSNQQTFIVSVRQPGPHGGRGITFAVSLEVTPKSESEMRLVAAPVVIDYDFYDSLANLGKLASNRKGVYSLVELDAISQKRPGDDAILTAWRSQMAKARAKIFGKVTASNGTKQYEIPIYDIATDKLIINDPPNEAILASTTSRATSMIVIQKLNPATGIATIHAGRELNTLRSEMARGQNGIPGHVDADRTGKFLVFPIVSLGGNSSTAVAMIDGQLKLLVLNQQDQVQMLSGGPIDAPSLRALEGVSFQSEINATNSMEHTIIVSYRNSNGGMATTAYVLTENAGNIVLKSSIRLNSKFATAKELRNRSHSVANQTQYKPAHELLFDGVSTTAKVIQDKPRSESLKSPLTNLTRSTNGMIAQTYLSPIEDQVLIPKQVSYRLYSEKGATQSQSGFYLRHYPDATGNPTFINGAALKMPGQTKVVLTDRLVGKEKLSSGSYSAEYKVSAIALNPNPSLKLPENRFQILIHVGSGDNDLRVSSAYKIVDVTGNFDQLIGATIVPGRRGRALNMTLILMFKEDPRKAKGRNGGGVQTINFNINGEAPNDDEMEQRISGVITNYVERNEISPNQVKSRLHYDTPGDLYWVVTPEKDVNDPHFKVKKLAAAEAEDLAPNRAGQRILLRFKEKIEDSFDSLYSSFSHWIISHKGSLDRISWWKEFLERRKAAKAAALFPKFEEFLESKASTGAPKHEVVLVEESLKQHFRELIFARLARDGGRFSFSNTKFNFFFFDSADNYKEVRDNLDSIVGRKGDQNLLYADLTEILSAEGIAVEKTAAAIDPEDQAAEEERLAEEREAASNKVDNPDEEQQRFDMGEDEQVDESRFPHSRLMALAGEGMDLDLAKFKNLTAHPKIPMMILATPAEWKAMVDAHPDEQKAGVFDHFNVSASFLTSTWSLWPVNSGKATEEIKSFSKTPVSKDEFQVFTALEQILMDSANPNIPARHRIVVVPNELKPLVRRLVLSRWATERNIDDVWTNKNPNLSLFSVAQDATNSQATIFENFEAMNGSVGSRQPVLIADMHDILKAGRPTNTNGASTFFLKDPAASQATATGLTDQTDTVNPRQLPHMMWLLASEGGRVQPKKTRDFKIKDEVPARIPTVIFASEEDLSRLEIDTAFERRFVDFRQEFEFVTLPAPSIDIRRKLIADLFLRPEIASLNYEFSHPPLNPEAAKDRLIGVMVNRLDQIATQFNQEPTTAFLRAYGQLRLTLTEDPSVRRTRILDNAFFERLYRKVFSIPLSFDILEAGDPLTNLRDPDKASLRMQELGYEGSPDPRRRVIETVISQTKANDPGRPIPSSAILFGGTSTGKTFLLNTLFKMMGLKQYDLDRPNEEGAAVFKINVGQITEKEDDPATASKMSITSIKRHLEHFLSQPNGARGMIFFDDFNRGSTEIKKELKAFIYNLMDSKNGMITVQNLNGDRVEIPIRNLSLFLTVNPQQDLEIKRRFTKEYGVKSIDDEIVAALASDGFQIDNSFTARFSLKLDMDKFPRDAKVPAVLSSTREFNLNEFSSRPRFVLVTPQLADALTNAAPNGNAREFITPAANALLEVDGNFGKAPVYILKARGEDFNQKLRDFGKDAGGAPGTMLDSFKLKEILKDVTVVQPVSVADIGTQIDLASFILNNFRTHLHNALVMEAQRSPRFIANKELRIRELSAFLMAVMHNITDASNVPFKYVRMHPAELEVTDQKQIFAIEKAISRNSEDAPNFLKVDFQSDDVHRFMTANEFLGQGTASPQKRTRATVLAETSVKIQSVLKELMGQVYYLGKLDAVDPSMTPEEWASRITNADQKAMFAQASAQLILIYDQFSDDLYSPDLLESIPGAKVSTILDYDRARLFMMAMDKALTQMPWAKIGHLTARLAENAVNDLAFGLSANLQTFLFKSTYSPMATITPDSVETYARSSEDLRDFETKRAHLRTGFLEKCDSLLTKQGPN